MRVKEEYGARVSNPALQWLPGGLPGQHNQDEVDHDGQSYAQYHTHQEPEQAPSSHVL
jgi:hypothetical protein